MELFDSFDQRINNLSISHAELFSDNIELRNIVNEQNDMIAQLERKNVQQDNQIAALELANEILTSEINDLKNKVSSQAEVIALHEPRITEIEMQLREIGSSPCSCVAT